LDILDYTAATPGENLAMEEALICAAEEGQVGEVLRSWESPQYFVVLGAGGAVAREVNEQACSEDGVPVLRRCSGGGTVVQGPGCLNYTLLLDRDAREELRTIDTTNALVLESVIRALQPQGVNARVEGLSDLAVDGVKFSGNAQRRRKRWVLFHGTILHAFELECLGKYLREPEKQPDYRKQREHAAFVRNIPLDVNRFKAELASNWGANQPLKNVPHGTVARLVAEKYASKTHNYAF
jgi:lipoate-protein ligase A